MVERTHHVHARARHDARRAARLEHRTARREELVEAAVRVIRRDGPGASMEKIAAEAGVTKPILYRFFDDREGLGQAVAEQFATSLLAELQTSLSTGGGPRELLAGTVDTYLAFIERDPNVYRFLVHGSHASAQSELAGFIRRVGQEVSLAVGEQLRAAGLDSGAAEPWAYGLVGMVHLAGDWWLDRRPMPRARLVEYLTTLVWDGLAATGVGGDATP